MGVEVSNACKKADFMFPTSESPIYRFWGAPWILNFDPDPRAVLRQRASSPGTTVLRNTGVVAYSPGSRRGAEAPGTSKGIEAMEGRGVAPVC